MRILLVVATEPEIAPLLRRLQHVSGNERFRTYRMNNAELHVAISGVGMVSTAAETAFHIGKSSYDLLINAGICGSFKREIQLGEVVKVVSEFQPELGAEDHDEFISVFDLGIADKNRWPYRNGWMELSTRCDNFSSLRKCKSVTVNTVSGDQQTVDHLIASIAPDVESMEGAGFIRAALMTDIPSVQIRAVSNYVEPRDRSKWDIPLAINNLNEALFNELIAITK
jgi:futalosine hydrolase